MYIPGVLLGVQVIYIYIYPTSYPLVALADALSFAGDRRHLPGGIQQPRGVGAELDPRPEPRGFREGFFEGLLGFIRVYQGLLGFIEV